MKAKLRIFGIITVIMLVMSLMVGCDDLFGNNDDDDTPGGENAKITIRNNTGYTLYGSASGNGLYIKLSNSSDWGSSITGFSSINNSESLIVTLPARINNNTKYDIRWDSWSGGKYTIYNVTLSFGMTVTFTQSDYDDGSQNPNITIHNLSGVSFDSIYVKPSSASDWGINLGSYSGLSSNSTTTISLPFRLTDFSVFDIQMRSNSPSNTYTKNNVNVSNGMTLTFYPNDSDNQQIINPVIIIQNNTGYTLYGSASGNGLYIKPTNSSDWGSSITGFDSINNSDMRAVILPARISNNNSYDIRWNSWSGGTYTKQNVSLSFGMTLTFNSSDLE